MHRSSRSLASAAAAAALAAAATSSAAAPLSACSSSGASALAAGWRRTVMTATQNSSTSSSISNMATTGFAWAPRRASGTLANVIAAERGKTRLQGYLPGGFVVNNAHVDGAIVCLPELWLSWDAASPADATPESLSVLLDLAAPKPEVLVVGCGARMRPLPAALARALEERGIAVEALDTRNALAYFNFLNEEGRAVAAALLPIEGDAAA